MEELAFLDLPDGRTLVGRGPFRRSGTAPVGGVGFYRNDFGLTSDAPWWLPETWELVPRGEAPARFGGRVAEGPGCTWEPPDASAFAAVFQEISAAIRIWVPEAVLVAHHVDLR